MSRAPAVYARRELRASWWRWLRANQRTALIFLALMAAVAVAETLLVLAWLPTTRFSTYTLGVVHAVVALGVVVGLRGTFLLRDRDALRNLRGAVAEEFTRDELTRARRRRLTRGVVNGIGLRSGDIDHVVVLRRGGVLAIDSKWRGHLSAVVVEECARAGRRTALRTRGLLNTVDRAASTTIPVRPVIALWGEAARSVPEPCETGGVWFVAGSDLVAWMRTLDGDRTGRRSARSLTLGLTRLRDTMAKSAA